MDASKPAQIDSEKFVEAINHFQVTTACGSPAIWLRVADYLEKTKQTLSSLRLLNMFGAPVSVELLERWRKLIPQGEIATPYGATEALPVSLIKSAEVLKDTCEKTALGLGTCVGKIVDQTSVMIADPEKLDQQTLEEKPLMEIGEILVSGDQVTREYYDQPQATLSSKFIDGHGVVWHRMGDMGYLDHQKRLWFCGRKVHRVFVNQKIYYSSACEGVFNTLPDVARSALIGFNGELGIVIEPKSWDLPFHAQKKLLQELKEMVHNYERVKAVKHFFIHKNFPVDTRHNIKIDRNLLAQWAGAGKIKRFM
jgi:acyl-CoA synthetase (AMP-forming)/AMP-acid ligase II